jgi:hypothetical protein
MIFHRPFVMARALDTGSGDAVTGRTSEPRGKETDPQQDRVGFKHGRSRSFRSGGVLGLDAIEAYLDRVLAFNSLPSRSAPWPLCAAAAAAG